MRRGQELEPEARRLYEVRTGNLVLESGIALTDDRVFGYSTDGLVADDGAIEIKIPASPTALHLAWTNPGKLALDYIDQMRGGLWITGRKWIDLVVYCPWLKSVGKDLLIHRVVRDENEIEVLEERLVAFARLVQAREIDFRTPIGDSGPAEEAPPVLIDQPLGAVSAVMRAPTVDAAAALIAGTPAPAADDPKPAAKVASAPAALLPESIPF
jgi:hypothetical protein